MGIRALGIGLALLALIGIAGRVEAADKVLRVVPQADLKVLDPHTNTATITLMHGAMIYDTLFAWDFEGSAAAADGRQLPGLAGPAGAHLHPAAGA